MRSNPKYQADPTEVYNLLDVCAKSKIRVHSLSFTGGEPTLWDYLEEGCRIARKFIGDKTLLKVFVITNGSNPGRIIKLKDVISGIFVTGYSDNLKNICELHDEFGKRCCVWPHEWFIKPLDYILPSEKRRHFRCLCQGPLYYAGRMYSCSMIPAMIKKFGASCVNKKSNCAVNPDWTLKLNWQQECCWGCVSNNAVKRICGGIKSSGEK